MYVYLYFSCIEDMSEGITRDLPGWMSEHVKDNTYVCSVYVRNGRETGKAYCHNCPKLAEDISE